MKKLYSCLVVVSIAILTFSFIQTKKEVKGNWTITYKNGQKTKIHFGNDGTFRTEIPAENFIVAGRYKYSKGVVSISDTSCNDKYWGKYRVTFHGTDSIYSVVIEDSCQGRKSSADKVFLVRDK